MKIDFYSTSVNDLLDILIDGSKEYKLEYQRFKIRHIHYPELKYDLHHGSDGKFIQVFIEIAHAYNHSRHGVYIDDKHQHLHTLKQIRIQQHVYKSHLNILRTMELI